jgi:predicted acylesterase/phospholipase RssA
MAPRCELHGLHSGSNRRHARRACDEMSERTTRERDFIAVALSGGGTKAAIFSAEAMFYLDALGLMPRVSIISAVSGGSFAAGLYALSCDPNDLHNASCKVENVRGLQRPIWQHAYIMPTVGQGYSPLAWEQGSRWIVPFMPATISASRFASYIDRAVF